MPMNQLYGDSKSNTVTQDELNDLYNYNRTCWDGYLNEAYKDVEYYLGAQFTQAEERSAQQLDRTLLVFNKIRRQVKLLSGYEVRNRHQLKLVPVGQEDDEVARQHSLLIHQQMARADGYGTLSMCFKMGMLISGSNLMEVYRDRDGFIGFSRLGYNQFLLDAALTKQDLTDCARYMTGRYFHEDVIKRLLPANAKDLPKIPYSENHGRWTELIELNNQKQGRKRLYEELWEKKTRFERTVISRMTGQEIPYKELLKMYNGDKQRAERVIKTATLTNGDQALEDFQKPINEVILKVFVDGVQLYTGPNSLGIDEYNVVWFPGEFFHEVPEPELKLQPFVRALRDPQKAKNRRLNQTIDIIESQLNSYKTVREKAIKNFKDVFQSGQGKVLVVDSEFEEPLAEAFRQESGADIPPGHFQLLATLDKEETEIGGMNNEIFGSDDGEVPGILARHRTGQALTGHQDLFESFRQAKRQLGKKLVKVNQINQDPVRVYRMINEPPTEGFYEPDLSYYDVHSVEGVMTDSQQQQLYSEVKELVQLWPQAAETLQFTDLLQLLPVTAKRELTQIIKQREQQRQQAMQKAQEDEQRMNRLVEAETQAKIARAQEDISDIAENRASTQLKTAKTAVEVLNLQNEQIADMAERLARIELMSAQAEAARAQSRQTSNNQTTKKNSPAKKRPKRRR